MKKDPKAKPPRKEKKKLKPPGGRPRLELSLRTITKLAALGCSVKDIAGVCGVSEDTLGRRLQDDAEVRAAYQLGLSQLCESLRRRQVKMALNGNLVMLIWLGKQYLGQKEPDKASAAPPPPDPDAPKPYGPDVATDKLRAHMKNAQKGAH